MQYSLLHSSSIAQHFIFLQNEIISTRIKVVLFLKFFNLKKNNNNNNGHHFKVIKVTPTKFIFWALFD